MQRSLLIFFLVGFIRLPAQTLGGNSVFNFLKLPNTPQLSALGGVNVSQSSNDIGLVFNNPALLKPSMHGQMNAVFHNFFAGINAWHLGLGYHQEKLKTDFAWGLMYIDYGKITETDASGNNYGQFRPTDWVMQVSGARAYLDKWNYGAALKFISSSYGIYRSNGLAMDVSVLYSDTSKSLQASVLVKNLGFQLKKYRGTDPDDLPFDLQAGISKRLEDAPFSFSFTAHHLHQFDIRYNDTTYNNDIGAGNRNGGKFFFDKLFRHFVFAATVYGGEKIEMILAYNHLRRKELNPGTAVNGLNGFSVGAGILLNKLQIRYARSHYQSNSGFNQLGLNFKLFKRGL